MDPGPENPVPSWPGDWMDPGAESLSDMSDDEDFVTIVTSEDAVRPGEEIRLHKDMSGLNTEWAIIANPYYHFPKGHPEHDPEWRHKDGDTVIGVEEGTLGARPVADMYQIFYDDEAQEKREREAWFAQSQAEYDAEEAGDPHEWMEDRFHQDQEDWSDSGSDYQKWLADLDVVAAEQAEERAEISAGAAEAPYELPLRQGMGRRPLEGPARLTRRGRKISEVITYDDLISIISEQLRDDLLM